MNQTDTEIDNEWEMFNESIQDNNNINNKKQNINQQQENNFFQS